LSDIVFQCVQRYLGIIKVHYIGCWFNIKLSTNRGNTGTCDESDDEEIFEMSEQENLRYFLEVYILLASNKKVSQVRDTVE